jgi:hypothetical protein
VSTIAIASVSQVPIVTRARIAMASPNSPLSSSVRRIPVGPGGAVHRRRLVGRIDVRRL